MEARKGVKLTPSSCSINNLPNLILMVILCRVSIKTLTASKSVCKSWLDLIKDPHFCQMHQSRSPTEVCFQPYHDVNGNTLELHLDDHFGIFPLPPCFDETDRSMLHGDGLGASGGCLFVIGYKNGGVTIWLMREYGVQGSWTKLFCSLATFDKGFKYHLCQPVTYMDNGEILITCTFSSSTVCVYNPVLKSGRVIGSGPVFLRVVAFNPSLVLLKDSMLGYDVHVTPKWAGLEQGEISTTPHWWTPRKDQWRPWKESPQQHGSKAPLIDDEL